MYRYMFVTACCRTQSVLKASYDSDDDFEDILRTAMHNSWLHGGLLYLAARLGK